MTAPPFTVNAQPVTDTGQVKTQTILIVPELARKWLEENVKVNRPVSDRMVKLYARAMTDGRWRENGEAITFDKDGNLINGQHRLWACIESNVSFRTLVAWDVPKDAFPTIDTGKKRSASDVLFMSGMDIPYKTQLAAAIRAILSYRGGYEINQRVFNNDEVLEFINVEPAVIQSVKTTRLALGGPLSGTASHVGAVMYLASHTKDVSDFVSKLGSGVGLVKGSPILTLRSKLLLSKGRAEARERFWSTVVAWNAYVDGRNLSIIRLPEQSIKIKGA